MLQEKYLPHYHFSETHSIAVNANVSRVFDISQSLDFSQSLIIRTLFFIRGLRSGSMTRDGLIREKFVELETVENREIIFGLVGQFWKPTGNLQQVSKEQFEKFREENFTKACWNFEVTQESNSHSKITTETRILCLGDHALKAFGRYWFFIRPFSGLIRQEILRAIKRQAERKPVVNSLSS